MNRAGMIGFLAAFVHAQGDAVTQCPTQMSCLPCTETLGCVWTGYYCQYSAFPINCPVNSGCANFANECTSGSGSQCNGGKGCSSGTTCQNGQCVSSGGSGSQCNAGKGCSSGTVCQNGQCVSSDAASVAPSGSCVRRCGRAGCGRTQSAPNYGQPYPPNYGQPYPPNYGQPYPPMYGQPYPPMYGQPYPPYGYPGQPYPPFYPPQYGRYPPQYGGGYPGQPYPPMYPPQYGGYPGQPYPGQPYPPMYPGQPYPGQPNACPATETCSCDPVCTQNNDCCSDYAFYCQGAAAPTPAPTCADRTDTSIFATTCAQSAIYCSTSGLNWSGGLTNAEACPVTCGTCDCADRTDTSIYATTCAESAEFCATDGANWAGGLTNSQACPITCGTCVCPSSRTVDVIVCNDDARFNINTGLAWASCDNHGGRAQCPPTYAKCDGGCDACTIVDDACWEDCSDNGLVNKHCPASSCENADENTLECNDGTICFASTATDSWGCCDTHGGRALCPTGYTMCNDACGECTISDQSCWPSCEMFGGNFQCETACDEICSAIFEPVCGSDMVTYSNQCALDVAACKLLAADSGSNDLIKLYDGQCVPVLGGR